MVTEENITGFEYRDKHTCNFLPTRLINPDQQVSRIDEKVLNVKFTELNSVKECMRSDNTRINTVRVMISPDADMHSSVPYTSKDISNAAEACRLNAKKNLHIAPVYSYKKKIAKLTRGTKDQKS
jgi:hypothetical protein